MRTVAALFVTGLSLAPSVAYALPFVPNTLEATSVAGRFVETGTDTACVKCEDLDPTNDLTLTLDNFGAGGYSGFGNANGFMSMTGFLESIRDADLTIHLTSAWSAITALGRFPKRLPHIHSPV